jgi:hypothetical protein
MVFSIEGNPMTDQDNSRIAANGFGLAAFALALQSLAYDVRSGRIPLAEAVEIISRARGFLSRVPGEQAATSFAESALKDAEQMLSAALAQTPPSGPH